jgi:protein TonB
VLLHVGIIAWILRAPPPERPLPPTISVEIVSAPEMAKVMPPQPMAPPQTSGVQTAGTEANREPGQAQGATAGPTAATAPSPPAPERPPAPASDVPTPPRPAPNSEPTPEDKETVATLPPSVEVAPPAPPQVKEQSSSPPSATTAPPSKPVTNVTPPRHPTRSQPSHFNLPKGPNGGNRYLSAVRDDILSKLIYPPAARYIRLEGTAQYGLLVDRQGRLLQVRLLQSSGADILDKAGMEMIERSAPLRPLPSGIKGDPVELVLTVHIAP